MPTEIVMPQMGAEMEEGTVVRWLKQPGDTIGRGDIIAEIETDKATVELESYDAGTLLSTIVGEGTTVPVGQVIAYLGAAGEQPPPAAPAEGSAATPSQAGAASGTAARGSGEGSLGDAPATTGANGATESPPTSIADVGRRENDRADQAERDTVTAAMVSESMRAERTTNAADTVDPARPGERDATPPAAGERRGTADDQSVPATDRSAPVGRANGQSGAAAPVAAATTGTDGRRLRASPVARNIAEEMGIDLLQVKGSGPEGRIMRRDVEEYARQHAATQVHGEEARSPAAAEPARAPRPAAPQVQAAPRAQAPAAPAVPAAPPTAAPAAAPSERPGDEVEPLTRMRQAIARRMAAAKREIPHYYVTVDVDMTDAQQMRRDLNAQLDQGDHISVNDLITKACALALERQPHFNASFTDTGITMHAAINIGIAVALEDGLIVPAILDCRGRSLGALARATSDVAERSRNGRLRPAELNDGTFTVSNLGMYGVETLIAIIQPGQAAILGVGRVQERPVVRDGQVVIRQMMTIALSADHRVTDGAQGARFIAEIKDLLEKPARLVL